MGKCAYCKNKGVLPVACELGAVDICKECAIKHQKRLGIKQKYIDQLNNEPPKPNPGTYAVKVYLEIKAQHYQDAENKVEEALLPVVGGSKGALGIEVEGRLLKEN